MIPYSRQSINNKDIAEVVKVLKSNFLTQGPKVNIFEKKILELVKAKFSVACNSATSALHLACLSLNLKPKDIVWTVPNTFVASVNCAINCGAKVDFVDIDPDTWNISIEKLEEKLRLAKKRRMLPKILIPVHFAGQPTEQKKIFLLAKKYKFKIIEDASHSIGGKHLKEPVGSCKWSDITVFSFHPVKIITTGEGGMALTNNKNLAEKMKVYRANGLIREIKNNDKPWYYKHISSGYNYRMSDISAALGLSQIKRLKKFVAKRNLIASIYKNNLDNLPIKFQKIEKYNLSSYHLFVIQLDLTKTKYSYKFIFNKLRKHNYHINLHYMPLHLSQYFKNQGFKKNQFPVSEKYGKTSISIPVYFDLKRKDILKFCKLISSFF